MKLIRLAAYGGVAGPVLFTVAWVVSSLRQAGHPATEVQLSGLAAPDARDPQLMMAAFVVLGCCSIGLGAALRRVAVAKSAGPWLVMAAGAATAAAGVFRHGPKSSLVAASTAHLAAAQEHEAHLPLERDGIAGKIVNTS